MSGLKLTGGTSQQCSANQEVNVRVEGECENDDCATQTANIGPAHTIRPKSHLPCSQ